MNYNIFNGNIYIIHENKEYSFPVDQFNQILNSDALLHLSMGDLLTLWTKELYGIPENIKEFLLKKVSLYDSSSDVNSFIYKDKEYWFDKNTRATLVNLANFSKDEFTFVLGDEELITTPKKAKEFLAKLELYAQKCFLNTNKHVKIINEIQLSKNREEAKTYIDSIINYDYTTGYPNKIVLE